MQTRAQIVPRGPIKKAAQVIVLCEDSVLAFVCRNKKHLHVHVLEYRESLCHIFRRVYNGF